MTTTRNAQEASAPAPGPDRIAVLGLGRMGTAIAARLRGCGRDVVGWTRSGRTADGAVSAPHAEDAVAGATVVVLALFDGPACAAVLDRVGRSIPPDAVVLNTSTIAPDEAAALAGRLGPAYVHAPVLGSVPAVAGGTLTVLAAGDPGALARVRPVLDALGDVAVVEDAARAAALKLVANGSLAGAVLALRDTLQQADALGLPRDQVLDVLTHGRLGGLVGGKRAFLVRGAADRTGPAQFTVGALAKDMALLGRASGRPLRAVADLAGSPAGAESDVAVVATDPAAPTAVLEPLHAYVRGHATGDPGHFRAAFLPSAHVEGLRDGAFVSWTVDDYCARFTGTPAPDEHLRRRRIDAVDVHGSVATASMTLEHGPDRFIDVFLLVHVDGGWRIANKAYHRAAAGPVHPRRPDQVPSRAAASTGPAAGATHSAMPA